MNKVIDIGTFAEKGFLRTYELEELAEDKELLAFAMKLAKCDPSEEAKKKESYKAGLLWELRGGAVELPDEELDMAAGGSQDGNVCVNSLREALRRLDKETI